MEHTILAEWLPDVVNDPVVVQPDDLNSEARRNLWSFSLSREMAATITVAHVERFSEKIIEARRKWLTVKGAEAMWIYWWHDEMVGQLRFSLVSTTHGRLPFGSRVIATPRLSEIIAAWLNSRCLEGIPWEEPQGIDDEILARHDHSDHEARDLRVWSAVIP